MCQANFLDQYVSTQKIKKTLLYLILGNEVDQVGQVTVWQHLGSVIIVL